MMFRKPITWVLLAILSLACTFVAARYFSRAFPIVTLDLRMDREQALAEADELAKKYQWGPVEFEQAASFGLDSQVQTYVELEVGGSEAFGEMLQGDLYSPYTWDVRHFREGEVTETRIYFKPSGEVYGFLVRLPEDQPGESLSPDEARALAEDLAREDWAIDLSPFRLVEQSEEVRPGGRTDHELVYEHTQEKIGEGLYRLSLTVGGDQLAGLVHSVKVPEAFERRYEEMRSSNEAIAFGASVVIFVLFLGGGCCFGLFILLRKRWVIWRQPLLWGSLIAFLQFLVGLNQLPLNWMSYDTALPAQGFLLRSILLIFAQSILLAVVMVVSFMAAESLTRKAFPDQIQFWRLWSPGVANTPEVLGRTVAGYLLVGIFFAYEVGLYFFSSRFLGWWTPSEALFHPDTLATYFPWLTAIAVSAQAGFWEECLFRAVPLAGAALLGQRFGGRKYWILGAFILQAIVFGAGHANYPAQPAYARLVELILPSAGFGVLYLLYGLLPAIVLHFVFDVVWFALPVFVSDTSGAWINQVVIVVLAALPLLVILGMRLKAGLWGKVGEQDLNSSWVPPEPIEKARVSEVIEEREMSITLRLRWPIYVSGVFGLLLWIGLTDFSALVPPLEMSREQAVKEAEEVIRANGFQLEYDQWKVMSAVEAPLNQNDRFVWREGGRSAYLELLKSYLGTQFWIVRTARFEGTIEERTEEFEVRLSPGIEPQFRHQLAETIPGPSLTEEDARVLAEEFIESKFNIAASDLTRVSSEPSKLPDRVDWTFVYSDPHRYPLDKGEARILVAIAGEEVSNGYRYVYVPEDWARTERNEQNVATIIGLASMILGVILLLGGSVVAAVSWARRVFSLRAFLTVFLSFFGLSIFGAFNNWPSLQIRFSTAQPYMTQLAITIVGAILSTLFLSVVVALLYGLAYSWCRSSAVSRGSGHALMLGISLGLLVGGVQAAVSYLKPDTTPVWPSFNNSDSILPLLGTATSPVGGLLVQTIAMLIIVLALNRFRLANKPWLTPIFFFLLGLILSGSRGVDSVTEWLLSGTLLGVVFWLAYIWILRKRFDAIPVAVAILVALGQIRHAVFGAYPGASAGAVIAILLVILIGVAWSLRLSKLTGGSTSTDGVIVS